MTDEAIFFLHVPPALECIGMRGTTYCSMLRDWNIFVNGFEIRLAFESEKSGNEQLLSNVNKKDKKNLEMLVEILEPFLDNNHPNLGMIA